MATYRGTDIILLVEESIVLMVQIFSALKYAFRARQSFISPTIMPLELMNF